MKAYVMWQVFLWAFPASSVSGLSVLSVSRPSSAAFLFPSKQIQPRCGRGIPSSRMVSTLTLRRLQMKIQEGSGNEEAKQAPHVAEADGAVTLLPVVTPQPALQPRKVDGTRRRRKPKSTPLNLPGSWWTAGLPKWMHILRRRMITKEDYLHAHAASGLIYLVGGSLWLINVMGLELFAGIPQLETSDPVTLFLLAAGLANILTAIPMANTRSWVLAGLCPSIMQLWYAWYVSGAYPSSFAAADPWLAAAGLTILVISYVEAEETIARESRARKHGRYGRVTFKSGDEKTGNSITRFGALANLAFNGPHLYSTLVGGDWIGRLGDAYPMAPAMMFHGYFALATASSLALLAPTLYSRKLIGPKMFSAMQFITIAPIITSLVDYTVMGSATTGNPMEMYLNFLS